MGSKNESAIEFATHTHTHSLFSGASALAAKRERHETLKIYLQSLASVSNFNIYKCSPWFGWKASPLTNTFFKVDWNQLTFGKSGLKPARFDRPFGHLRRSQGQSRWNADDQATWCNMQIRFGALCYCSPLPPNCQPWRMALQSLHLCLKVNNVPFWCFFVQIHSRVPPSTFIGEDLFIA